MQHTNGRAGVRSFLRGLGRALDVRGAVVPTYARRPRRTPPSDHAAMAADWDAVWNDLGTAFARVKQRDAARAHG
ncbi:MAG TPA: hypothetical protein VF541_22665 [Longimicrobium sp.]|jgi:hypothetical protein